MEKILKVYNYYSVNVTILILHILFSAIFIYVISLIVDIFRKEIVEKKLFENIYEKYLNLNIKKIEDKLNNTNI